MKANQGVEAARHLLRCLLKKHKQNILKVSRMADCSRECVYRARDGTLEDVSRAPHTIHPSKLKQDWEDLILAERDMTHYGKKRMKLHLESKYGIEISSETIQNVFRRHKVTPHRYVRSKSASKPLYDYEHLLPFEMMQIDTKHIEDFGALGAIALIPRKR